MLGKLPQVSDLVNYHRVCAWQVITGCALGRFLFNTGFALDKLTQSLRLVSKHMVCVW